MPSVERIVLATAVLLVGVAIISGIFSFPLLNVTGSEGCPFLSGLHLVRFASCFYTCTRSVCKCIQMLVLYVCIVKVYLNAGKQYNIGVSRN